jgi:N-hydroxyarylamine O-acetyltransferase
MPTSPHLAAYLERIGYAGAVEPTVATLRGMHEAHFLAVPFENLSIQRGEAIVVDPEANYRKIVERRRGGFCLELTGLFAWALREIGFEVDLLGGRVMSATGALGRPLEHMALLVRAEDSDERWLADVGFGGGVATPLRLDERDPQTAYRRTCVIAQEGDVYLVTCTDPWQEHGPSLYVLTLEPHAYEDYASVCHWLQSSPESSFTKGDMASLPLPDGRITYSTGRLIVTTDAGREETEVPPDDVPRALLERFGLAI